MPHGQPPEAPKTNWAYAYELVPPQAEDRLGAIKTILDHAHRDAKQDARTWEGRFVLEEQITHILVVSDDPDQHNDVNRRLQGELRNLEAGFSLTVAMAVPDEPTPPPVRDS